MTDTPPTEAAMKLAKTVLGIHHSAHLSPEARLDATARAIDLHVRLSCEDAATHGELVEMLGRCREIIDKYTDHIDFGQDPVAGIYHRDDFMRSLDGLLGRSRAAHAAARQVPREATLALLRRLSSCEYFRPGGKHVGAETVAADLIEAYASRAAPHAPTQEKGVGDE